MRYKPNIIVNLCTRGLHEKDLLASPRTKIIINKNTTLQELTQLAIHECIKNKSTICIGGKHPSSWHCKKIDIWKV